MKRSISIVKVFALAGALVLSLGSAAQAAPGCTVSHPAQAACRYQSTTGNALSVSGSDVGPFASITINAYVNGTWVGSCTNSALFFASCSISGPPVGIGNWVTCVVSGATVGSTNCND